MERNIKSFGRNVDFNSLAIGLLLGLCLMLAIGAAAGNGDEPGQYQCCAAGDDDLAVFVVETSTGHTWRLGRSDNYDLGTPYARKSLRQSVTPMVD
ncbi:MAG: hypothetical protein ACYS14_02120 [Planctomycetota bacterium]|jgi:hypothetical protein